MFGKILNDYKNHEFIVFGTGFAGKLVMYLLNHIYEKKITCCFDNDICKSGKKYWDEVTCLKPQMLKGEEVILICVFDEGTVRSINEQCKKLGYKVIIPLNETQVISATMNMEERQCVEVMYYCATDETLDLDNPIKYNEKLQWLKVFDHNPLYRELTDKIRVKEYVRNKIGEKYVVPTLGVWDRFNDIDFDHLPDRFVLKCTHDSGSVVIVDGKTDLKREEIRCRIDKALSTDYYYTGREFGYKGIPRKIIAEPKLNGSDRKSIKDYKVFVFSGIPKIVQVDYNRFSNHTRIMYSSKWENLGFSTRYPFGVNDEEPRPKVLDELLEVSRVLSEGLTHVRADFYIVDDHIYFGEMTFHHGGGWERFSDESWNYKMGEWLVLPEKTINV